MASARRQRNVAAIIPARFASSRFPGKPLASIAGEPMIVHVVRRTKSATRIDEVWVATDDERIAAVAEKAGAGVVMTAGNHASGTDRIAEAAGAMDVDVIINVQGDQPLIDPHALDLLAAAMTDDPGCQVATLAAPLTADRDWANPDVVKVVLSQSNQALYFSRAAVPYWRDGQGRRPDCAWKHIGVYGFRRALLLEFPSWPSSPLERLESLEQLRILERGVAIRVVPTNGDSPSVDRPEDIARIEQRILDGADPIGRAGAAPVPAAASRVAGQ